MVASDQFFSISDMLNDLALEFDEAEIFDANAAGKIRRFLGDYEMYPANISAIEDKFGRMRIEILFSGFVTGLDNPKLRHGISKICSRYFEDGRITNFKNETMLSFYEKPCHTCTLLFCFALWHNLSRPNNSCAYYTVFPKICRRAMGSNPGINLGIFSQRRQQRYAVFGRRNGIFGTDCITVLHHIIVEHWHCIYVLNGILFHSRRR